jgi:hypothetical protein
VWGQDQSWLSPAEMDPEVLKFHHGRNCPVDRPPNPPLKLRFLYRFPVDTSFVVIAERVKGMLEAPPLAGRPTVLLVDKTGVGAGVVDTFVHLGIRPIALTIHGGSRVTSEPSYAYAGYRVPKRDLVAAVKVCMQQKRLDISRRLEGAKTLKKELENFRFKIDPQTAHDSYEHWREGDHDDLVLATAMAVWFREWWNEKVEIGYASKERKRDEEAEEEGTLRDPRRKVGTR